MIVLFINEDNRPIGFSSMAKGRRDHVEFSWHDLMKLLILSGAASFIIAHNHPNGSAQPSQTDIHTAINLKPKVSFLGFEFEDNIILTKESYYSFREQKMFWDYE